MFRAKVHGLGSKVWGLLIIHGLGFKVWGLLVKTKVHALGFKFGATCSESK